MFRTPPAAQPAGSPFHNAARNSGIAAVTSAVGAVVLVSVGVLTAPAGALATAVVAVVTAIRTYITASSEAQRQHTCERIHSFERHVGNAVSEDELTHCIGIFKNEEQEMRKGKVTDLFFGVYVSALEKRINTARIARGLPPGPVSRPEPDEVTQFVDALRVLDSAWVRWPGHAVAVSTTRERLENLISTSDGHTLRCLQNNINIRYRDNVLQSNECKWHLFETLVSAHDRSYVCVRSLPIIQRPRQDGPRPGERI